MPSATPSPSPASPTSAPGPTVPSSTGRWNASTAPCSRNGPTPVPTAARPPAVRPSRSGCTLTTTTAATPRSEATHPRPASPTSVVSTARARYARKGQKVVAYTPKTTTSAERDVAWRYRAAAAPGAGRPLERQGFGLACTFYLTTRQRRDVDNMIKLVSDALTGVAWADDSQVTEVSGR